MKIKAIAGLIPMHLHLWKLSSRNQLQTATLPYNYVVNMLLKRNHINNLSQHQILLKAMTLSQKLNIKSFIVNANNCLNGVFLLFDSLNREFHIGQRLADKYSSQFSFHKAN